MENAQTFSVFMCSRDTFNPHSELISHRLVVATTSVSNRIHFTNEEKNVANPRSMTNQFILNGARDSADSVYLLLSYLLFVCEKFV